jgi:hypothetical protein
MDRYSGLLGKIVFDACHRDGRTQEEIDALWEARFPKPSNVINLAEWKASRELPAD